MPLSNTCRTARERHRGSPWRLRGTTLRPTENATARDRGVFSRKSFHPLTHRLNKHPKLLTRELSAGVGHWLGMNPPQRSERQHTTDLYEMKGQYVSRCQDYFLAALVQLASCLR